MERKAAGPPVNGVATGRVYAGKVTVKSTKVVP
jgi:hypothetical protein